MTYQPDAVDAAMCKAWRDRTYQDWTALRLCVVHCVRICALSYHGAMRNHLAMSSEDLAQMILVGMTEHCSYDHRKAPAKSSPRCWNHLYMLAQRAVAREARDMGRKKRSLSVTGSIDGVQVEARHTDPDIVIERVNDAIASGLSVCEMIRAVKVLQDMQQLKDETYRGLKGDIGVGIVKGRGKRGKRKQPQERE